MIKVTVKKTDGSINSYQSHSVAIRRNVPVPGGTDNGFILDIKEPGIELPLDETVSGVDFDNTEGGTEAADAGL